jgi:hypothetical protein
MKTLIKFIDLMILIGLLIYVCVAQPDPSTIYTNIRAYDSIIRDSIKKSGTLEDVTYK